MAVTFTKQPKLYSPSDNPLMYEFSSNQTGQVNFSFVVETYLDTVKVGEDRVFVERGTKAHFDSSKNISPLMFINPMTSANLSTISTGVVKLKVTESYGTTPTLQATATSSDSYTWKSRVSDALFTTIDFDNDYKLLKFLTTKPDRKFIVPFGVDVYLGAITGGAVSFEVRMYDVNGNSLGIFSPVTGSSLMHEINLNSDFYTSLEPLTTSITVTVESSLMEYFTVEYIVPDCGEFTMLYWLNDFGCFDQYNFDHSRIQTGTTESKGYTKQFGQWTGTDFGYTIDAGERNIIVQTMQKAELNSGYMDGITQNWLNECLQSPRHWFLGQPMKMLSASFIDEQDRFEDLISMSVELQYSMNKFSLNL